MSAIMSIMMLTALALVAGAVYLMRNGGTRLQITLMLVLAVVIAGNVWLWGSMPDPATTMSQGQAK